ncbi:hypothetical protein K0504_16195 [Neiella marina]|uniref:Nitrogenase-stabilizing/protective protein NifW n=1 Tax=Neiella holothuriorum TaxID=2870530 RepID=A0ABS7EJS8_9GAMM|nr:nitrogenase-stabilizing/protective protein NifW [Neiella holothuriorum]MBW8192580.1 hypothetical protein [Neiella holothuriorum]
MQVQATDMDLAIAELNSAESFLDFFDVKYHPLYLKPRRIKFMRLFRQQLEKCAGPLDWNDYYHAVANAYKLLERDVVMALNGGACSSCSGCPTDDQPMADNQPSPARSCAHD